MKKLSTRSRTWRSVMETKRWSTEEAGQVLAAWEASGATLGAFARTHGLSPNRLWRSRVRLCGKHPAAGPAFHPVRVLQGGRPVCFVGSAASDVSDPLELIVAGSRRIVIRGRFDPEVLTALVRAVESWGC